MGWRKVFEEFGKTDGQSSPEGGCLFCKEVNYGRGKTNGCAPQCPLICLGDNDTIGLRCVYVFEANRAMTDERRLSICQYVLKKVKFWQWRNLAKIRAAISSQLTEDERELYEGE